MNLTELVHHKPGRAEVRSTTKKRSAPLFCTELAAPIRNAILRARQFLISQRGPNGLWVGRTSADASLASLLIFWLVYTGSENSELAQQCAATVVDQQLATGGWARFTGGLADVSVSVQCYFALKLLGIDPTSTGLSLARNTVRQLGGADACDVETRYLLALFGQIDYDHCPAMPPEQVMFHGAYRRQGPQSAIRSRRPVKKVSIDRGVRELFFKSPNEWPKLCAAHTTGSSLRSPHTAATIVLRRAERFGWTPFRQRATGRITAELTAQLDISRIGQLQFDELIWHALAVRALGVEPNCDLVRASEARLDELTYVDEVANAAAPQRSPTPLADSALAIRSLLASGLSPNHVAIASAEAKIWKQLTSTAATASPTEDLAALLLKRHAAQPSMGEVGTLPPAIEVLDDCTAPAELDQSPDGCDQKTVASQAIERLLTRLNDATTAGTMLEAVAADDSCESRRAVDDATRYLTKTQLADGSWGNDGGGVWPTASAVCGLIASGISADDELVAAGVNWLIVQQHTDGGWCDANWANNDRTGNSLPTPTAGALMALVAAGKPDHRAARRAVHFLIDEQDDEGRWTEPTSARSGATTSRVPANDLQSVAWPLLALSRWAVAAISTQSAAASEMSLRLVSVSDED